MYSFDGLTTPIGRIHIVASDQAIVRIHLPGTTWKEQYVRSGTHPLLVRAKAELREFFEGRRTHFSLPLAPEGTLFQERAWNVLSQIPYGATITYQEEAKRAGNPHAPRAVGNANAQNPIPIMIPCHRVIRSDATLGGYAGGVEQKAFLLSLEAENSLAKKGKKDPAQKG